jgi:hypothetical protein
MKEQENDNQTTIEDLPIDAAQQDQVKGGRTGTPSVSEIIVTKDMDIS